MKITYFKEKRNLENASEKQIGSFTLRKDPVDFEISEMYQTKYVCTRKTPVSRTQCAVDFIDPNKK